ncbi:MAG: hypothetical protein DRO12_00625 [Thermoprotei archaeon]|nr:MAG: hypothetical protein DRO12_00625 [Thermoprotei archaeon]
MEVNESKRLSLLVYELQYPQADIEKLKRLVQECCKTTPRCSEELALIPYLRVDLRVPILAYLLSLEAFRQGRNVSRKLDIEILLRIFGTRQIRDMLAMLNQVLNLGNRNLFLLLLPASCRPVAECLSISGKVNVRIVKDFFDKTPSLYERELLERVSLTRLPEHLFPLLHLEIVAMSDILFRT